MLVNNLMRNLNTNLTKMDKLHNQLATGRKFAHISDDPTALIYSQAARSRLARLSHYQKSVATGQDWLRQVESGVMELQGRVADIYTELINAATDVKSDGDKNNVAMLVAQLRDHYVDTLNATFGDKYMYAGYNTPGDSKTGKVTGPFTLDATWNLRYNGHPLSEFLRISVGGAAVDPNQVRGVFGGLNIDISGETDPLATPPGVPLADRVNTAVNAINDILSTGIPATLTTPEIRGLNELNAEIKDKYDEIVGIKVAAGDLPAVVPAEIQDDVDRLVGLSITGLESVIERLDGEIADLPDNFPILENLKAVREIAQSLLTAKRSEESTAKRELDDLRKEQETSLQELAKYINTDNPKFDSFGRVTLTIGGQSLLGVDSAIPADNVSIVTVDPGDITKMTELVEVTNRLSGDVLTFDVGPAVSMPVTINGIDLALFRASDGTTRNIFNVLHEIYQAASSGAGADELTRLIRPVQDAQNHLLTKVAELGGRTRRLELLSARYEQDEINYEQMKSDAEDADMAEIIMYQKMAEAVYQAALSAGARIIQPTLMDFLR